MGIIVSKESLRPYHSISTVDETEFHSINMELGQTNGMSVGKEFHKKRWNQMFRKSQNDRFSSTGDDKQVRPPKTTFRR